MKVTRQRIKEIQLFRKVVGVFLIIIGIAGIILPILPGWVLIFVGLSMLGIHFYYVEVMKEYAIEQAKKAKERAKRRRKKEAVENEKN